MLILLAAIFILHITCICLLLAATIHNAWWVTETMSTDIWGRWILIGGNWSYTENLGHYPQEYLQVVQASSVLACLFCILGLFVFVAQLYTIPKGKRFVFTGVFQLLAWLCIMIAASIYTNIFHKDKDPGWYGASFILAWISVCLTFISCISYFILRKKKA
ncbi:epithelial membrane protein 2-like [Carassius auratus]|uniref:Epithelial membrane protein 1 n=1 Tax=Carassius auratus TaxID=7957 RepID=A0A6P6K4T6_CARAU|nr:epithelial membrane protein 2-like [Carassius auratus]XP_052410294.1 epithelial membrane protein 2-like [Carassius gibelio]